MQELPDLTAAIKYEILDDGSREALTAAWKSWIEEAGEHTSLQRSPTFTSCSLPFTRASLTHAFHGVLAQSPRRTASPRATRPARPSGSRAPLRAPPSPRSG
jgi:hypothetical protein